MPFADVNGTRLFYETAVELASIGAYMEHDVRVDAAKIVAPTLVLHGSDDREVPVRFGHEIAQTIPGAVLRVVQGAGHSLIHRTEEAVKLRSTSYATGRA